MKTLEELLRLDKTIRVIGFDDAPFEKRRGAPVNLAGIVCAQVRFEGMLWGEIKRDGDGATDAIIELLGNSKFADQVHIILTDGLAFGGFNLIDLPRLAEALGRPCVAVMRKLPDMDAIDRALESFEDAAPTRDMFQKRSGWRTSSAPRSRRARAATAHKEILEALMASEESRSVVQFVAFLSR
jgi:endonuclease V-like protein UPF0215 family